MLFLWAAASNEWECKCKQKKTNAVEEEANEDWLGFRIASFVLILSVSDHFVDDQFSA